MLLHTRSLVGSIIDTRESSFRKRQGLHLLPRNVSDALGPSAGRGRARRDPVEHCDHVLDLGAVEPLRDKHDLAAAVGIWPVAKPRQIVQEMLGTLDNRRPVGLFGDMDDT